MADTFKGEIVARCGWKWTTADGNLADDDKLLYTLALTDGYDAGEAEAKWSEEDSELLDGATRTLNLAALTKTLFGDTITVVMLSVRAIMIVSAAASTGQLIVGNAASDEWSDPFGADGDTVKIDPGSVLLFNSKVGWDVDDNNKNLKLAASGGDVTYSIVIFGTITDQGSSSSGSA